MDVVTSSFQANNIAYTALAALGDTCTMKLLMGPAQTLTSHPVDELSQLLPQKLEVVPLLTMHFVDLVVSNMSAPSCQKVLPIDRNARSEVTHSCTRVQRILHPHEALSFKNSGILRHCLHTWGQRL